MTWTTWKSPTSIRYWTDEGITFNGDGILDSTSGLLSTTNLYGLSTNYDETVNSYGTKGLILTGFNFDIGGAPVAEVAVMIEAQRLARIIDDRVQLWNSRPLGSNVADDSAENVKTYEGTLGDFWGIKTVNVAAADFGVLVDFTPRPDMPSGNKLVLRKVKMRIRY